MDVPIERQNMRNGSQEYGTPVASQDVIDLLSSSDQSSEHQKTGSDTPIPTGEIRELVPFVQQTVRPQEVDPPKQPAKKFEFLYKTLINIECGPKWSKHPIHKELLCSLSDHVNFLFKNSKMKAKEYKQADNLERELQEELQIATDDFRTRQVVDLLRTCFDSYPMCQYQAGIKKVMRNKTNKIFGIPKYSRVALPNGGLPKRASSTIPGEGLHETLGRVLKLKPEGVQSEEARKDRTAAAAQGRLILPHYSPIVMDFFVHWLYREELLFQNATQLCELYGLAQELGVTRLSDHCKLQITEALFKQIDKFQYGTLSEASLEAVTSATSQPQPSIIEIPEEPLLDVAYAMLVYVLKVREPPAVLRSLVIDTLAFGGNAELLKKVAPRLPAELILGICQVLCERAEHAEAGYPRMTLGMAIQARHEQKYQAIPGLKQEDGFNPESSTASLPDYQNVAAYEDQDVV